MSTVSYSRQMDFVDPMAARNLHANILGLGTVGSHAAVELARLGVGSFYLVDGDVVEDVNLPSQAYTTADVGSTKAAACAAAVKAVSDHATISTEQKMLAGGEVFAPGVVILAVDDMDVRKQIVELSLAWRPSYPLVIDGRMAGQNLQLFAFNPSDQAQLDRWQSFWFPAEEARQVACGGRSVSYIGALVGGLIASHVQKQLKGEPVPFLCSLDLSTLMLQKFADLLAALPEIDPREQAVIRLRYGLDGPPHSLLEVGEELGVTRERVRQLEGRAIKHLREATPGA